MGASRRFQVVGERQGVLIVDDYAHHPTEIAATLRAAREGWNRRIIAVFQPHRYSRTQLLMDEFAAALATQIWLSSPTSMRHLRKRLSLG